MGLFLGLMSGTSADAIDAAVIEATQENVRVVSSESYPISAGLRRAILSLYEPSTNEIDRLGKLDNELGNALAHSALAIIKKANLTPSAITAIGSHGQTIRHRPTAEHGGPFTLQIGDANVIAQQTGITTISDFRRRDMACGGQGAPLAPAFHQFAFSKPDQNRAVLNIGGIANLTYLPVNGPVIGFDTGPGNGLMDAWIEKHKNVKYDKNGDWAKTGSSDSKLLSALMDTPFITMPPPKSTGREAFCLSWLEAEFADLLQLSPETVQATLLQFTAQSITYHIDTFCQPNSEIYVCGGGVYNNALMDTIKNLQPDKKVSSTQALGINPDDVEAVTFAWLAMRTFLGLHGNLPSVTGAEQHAVLGAIYST